ncbi:MAG TPA: GYD domain-containing protein [Streptosporangiaceae bacterium]|nr:GYD domain-containing protein [Streptosporangiaceae bacterium]
MPKYIAIGSYSSGSWARLMRSADDRTAMARTFTEALGGSLDCIYWEVSARTSYALAELPDSATAAAAIAVLAQTGAFKNVEVHELLTQRQLGDVLALAGDVSQLYRVPGEAADTTV